MAAFLIGGNGLGKTTLFNCLAGWIQPSAGSIELCGSRFWTVVTDSSAHCCSMPLTRLHFTKTLPHVSIYGSCWRQIGWITIGRVQNVFWNGWICVKKTDTVERQIMRLDPPLFHVPHISRCARRSPPSLRRASGIR